jgi:hypothetical protein
MRNQKVQETDRAESVGPFDGLLGVSVPRVATVAAGGCDVGAGHVATRRAYADNLGHADVGAEQLQLHTRFSGAILRTRSERRPVDNRPVDLDDNCFFHLSALAPVCLGIRPSVELFSVHSSPVVLQTIVALLLSFRF